MGYVVGVDFGSVLSVAGIVKWDNGFPSIPECVRVIGPVPSVAYVNSDGTLLFGNAALVHGERNPQRVIRDFKRRLGDPVPIMVDDWSEHTENVVAAVIRHIVDDIAQDEGARPDGIAVTHPAGWGTFKQELLSAALAAAGLTDVLLVPEPDAAATNTARVAPPQWRTFVVYDLGAGSFEAAVMSRVGDTIDEDPQFAMLGHSQGMDWLGGSDFDQAIFSRVQRAAGLKNLDPTDAEVLACLTRLRRDCTVAKELLSIDTEATVTVFVAGRRRRIRLVRSEFEELIRDAIDDTVDITQRAIASAGLAAPDIDAIVLVGGSSRIPLVAQVISAEFSLPILVDPAPEAATALGAARLARAVRQARSAALAVAGDRVDLGAANAGGAAAFPDARERDTATAVGQAQAEQAAGALVTATVTQTSGAAPPAPLPMPAWTPAPNLGPGGSAGPVGRPDQLDRRGRHRRRGISRYWIHVVGIVGAVALIISAGSALAISQASDQNSPPGSRQADGANLTTNPTTTPVASTPVATAPAVTAPNTSAPTTAGADPTAGTPTAALNPAVTSDGAGSTVPPGPAAAGDEPGGVPAPEPAGTGGPVAGSAGPGSTPSTFPWLVPDVPSNSVGAPAVVVDLSELLPPDPVATEPTRDVSATGASVATP